MHVVKLKLKTYNSSASGIDDSEELDIITHQRKNSKNIEDLCGDCTSPTPICCGYGPCNMFCCNCDKGCRKGNDDVCASCPKDGPKCKRPISPPQSSHSLMHFAQK
uniref:Uncharacterized protein n=1 Tax=Romanomermis culicivorax TaxID=13658 RepID=A0A915KZU5_ROMCU